MARASLLDQFLAPADPRQPGKVLYPLSEIMRVMLAAAEDFMEVRLWGRG